MNILHKPVLLTEVIEHLAIEPTDMIVDGTIGYGGHSRECLKQLGPSGQLIGFDQDKVAIDHCETYFNDPRVRLIQENFSSDSLLSGKGLLRKIFIFSFLMEVLGTILLYFTWSPQIKFPHLQEQFFYSLFHSVSAFNNAGFTLFSDGLSNHLGMCVTMYL